MLLRNGCATTLLQVAVLKQIIIIQDRSTEDSGIINGEQMGMGATERIVPEANTETVQVI